MKSDVGIVNQFLKLLCSYCQDFYVVPKMKLFILLIVVSIVRCTEIESLQDSTLPSTVVDQQNVADAINDFGYKLMLTMMKQNRDQNVVLSPTSVAGLLAMTLLGTIGKTHEELAAALGFSPDIIESRKSHEHFGNLLHSLNTNDTCSKTLYADAMFVDVGAKIRNLFSSYLSRVYRGEALSVDFRQAVEVKDDINRWVETHTEGKIENFLQKPLPTSTKAVLLSALYFRGKWENPFFEEYTAKEPFTKSTNETVMADMMLNMGKFKYIFSENDDLHMVALPYNDNTTTLYVLMPRVPRRLSLHDLLTRLSSPKINRLIDTMEKSQCMIKLPKMDFKSNAKLENPLKALGIQSLFTPGQANFALMIDTNTVPNKTEVEILSRFGEGDARGLKETLQSLPNPGLHVDSVIHDVKLTINEHGTEAVAATSGVLARSVKNFRAVTPFYMFIRNERTKLITFSAVINDPTL